MIVANTVQTVGHRVQRCPLIRLKQRCTQLPHQDGRWNPGYWCTSIEATAYGQVWAFARTNPYETSWWTDVTTSQLSPIVSSSRRRSRKSPVAKYSEGVRNTRRGAWPCPVCMTRVCLPELIKLRRCLECSLKSRPLYQAFPERKQVSPRKKRVTYCIETVALVLARLEFRRTDTECTITHKTIQILVETFHKYIMYVIRSILKSY